MPEIRDNPSEAVPSVPCCVCTVALTDVTGVNQFLDNSYCNECLNEETVCCEDCGDRIFRDDRYYIDRVDRVVCSGCFGDSYFECQNCGDLFHNDDYAEDSTCDNCWQSDDSEFSDFQAPHSSRLNYEPNVNSRELVSDEKGKIIKSPRLFGIELECTYTKPDSPIKLAEEISNTWGFSGDGSIRRGKNTVGCQELISPIMSGKKGEDEVIKLSKTANKVGYVVNKSCGYHLHLDAPEYKRNRDEDTEEAHPHSGDRVYYIFETGIRLPSGEMHMQSCQVERMSDIPKKPNGEYVKYRTVTEEGRQIVVNRGSAFSKLRNLWYVYVAFDDIFRGMQPPSRRNNNFCISTSSLYSLDSIRDLDDYSELERLWYRVDRRRKIEAQIDEVENAKRYKHSSRYSGFNLEPLLRQNSANIEFRYHSPTLNSEKILRWVDIHQTILDYVARNGIDQAYIDQILTRETHLIRKAEAMCAYFKIRKETKEYILERLHKFNKIKDSNVEDEEVEDSELGSPAHQPPVARMRGEPVEARRSTMPRFEAINYYMTNNMVSGQNTVLNPYVVIDEVIEDEGLPDEDNNQ